jgi:hypothetical protein
LDEPASAELAALGAEVVRSQVAADGSQPAELARSRGYYYSGYNLRGMLRVAELSWCAGVDLFGSSDAPRRALDALLPALVDPGRWPTRSVEPSDDRRHGDLLVHAVSTWPGHERISAALTSSRVRPRPDDLVWVEFGVDPDAVAPRRPR